VNEINNYDNYLEDFIFTEMIAAILINQMRMKKNYLSLTSKKLLRSNHSQSISKSTLMMKLCVIYARN